MSAVRRMPVQGCIHPETFKYFLEPSHRDAAWHAMENEFDERTEIPSPPLWEIRTEHLLIRAPRGGSPMTVIRRSGCTPSDIERLHQLIGFEGDGRARA